jgi:hypothetical protein
MQANPLDFARLRNVTMQQRNENTHLFILQRCMNFHAEELYAPVNC